MLHKEMREQTLLLNQTNALVIREIYYSLATEEKTRERKHDVCKTVIGIIEYRVVTCNNSSLINTLIFCKCLIGYFKDSKLLTECFCLFSSISSKKKSYWIYNLLLQNQ